MTNLEFEISGDWNLQGSNKKDLYISFVAKIDDWTKNIIFYKKDISKEAFDFLLQQIMENKPRSGWKFSVITRGGYMNSIFISQLLWIKDEYGNTLFEEENVYC